MKISRNKLRLHRKRRTRAKIKGTNERPRLSIFRSLKNVYAQVIDDTKGVTLAQVSLKGLGEKNVILGAKKAGANLAVICKDKKIETIIFDRSGYKYHGKVKALAEGAREGGLKF